MSDTTPWRVIPIDNGERRAWQCVRDTPRGLQLHERPLLSETAAVVVCNILNAENAVRAWKTREWEQDY